MYFKPHKIGWFALKYSCKPDRKKQVRKKNIAENKTNGAGGGTRRQMAGI